MATAEGATAGALVRQMIIRTLSVALIAARAAGRYGWTTPVDLDQLVTDTAWDHLDSLEEPPPDATRLAVATPRRHDAPNRPTDIHATLPKERA
ncbi:hypothetical protein [Actinophytocola sediminis]